MRGLQKRARSCSEFRSAARQTTRNLAVVKSYNESHMQSFSRDSVALLAADFRRVDSNPAGELVEQFYSELRRLASSRMKGERGGHTWQTTALVNELYLELL